MPRQTGLGHKSKRYAKLRRASAAALTAAIRALCGFAVVRKHLPRSRNRVSWMPALESRCAVPILWKQNPGRF